LGRWAIDHTWTGDEAVAVEAHLLPSGQLQPTAFIWRSRYWRVVGLGREWEDKDGRHILVITSDMSRFELCLTSGQSSWRMLRAWERPYLA
jgi:hypothetical protein